MNLKRTITKVLGYNMGKAALDCYNQWFAVEMANRYGDKIRMNALAPEYQRDEVAPLGEAGGWRGNGWRRGGYRKRKRRKRWAGNERMTEKQQPA